MPQPPTSLSAGVPPTERIARTPHRRMRQRGLVVGLLTLALSATLLAWTPSAQAHHDEVHDHCGITRGWYSGLMMCDQDRNIYWIDDVTYQGRRHTFVVGSNRQIYYIWQRYAGDNQWSGWRSLGGYGTSKPAVLPLGPSLHLQVRGTGHRWYCKVYAPANGWAPWYGC